MAKLKGIIKFIGSIGDITFYKTRDGYMVREKSGIDANRIANDPAFQRTRENNAEFARAGKASKVLRIAFREILVNAADKRMMSRLCKQMLKVIQADAVNERGLRNVIDGEAELLAGFEFNKGASLEGSLQAPFTAAIDRVSGELTVDISSFIPSSMVIAPGGATHFQIISAGAAIDFEEETSVSALSESAVLPINSVATAAISQTNQVPAASTHPLFLALGIKFFQDVNGIMYPLKNGAFNALSLVEVSGV